MKSWSGNRGDGTDLECLLNEDRPNWRPNLLGEPYGSRSCRHDSEGEEFHVAVWPGSWVTDKHLSDSYRDGRYCDLFPAIREHAFEKRRIL